MPTATRIDERFARTVADWLRVVSEAGRGSTFRVELPVAENVRLSSAPRRGGRAAPK
jgi:hypothetical protein